MRRSPLHELNASLGARFVEFGGWEMPVQYESVLAEHRAVRESCGVFDVTHLGRFALQGPGAHEAVRSLFSNDIDRVGPGRCQYTTMLNEAGGIIDDLIVWRWEDERFWVMPNAANHDRVMQVFSTRDGCEVEDLQTSTVFLAVQGPEAVATLEGIVRETPGRFRCGTVHWRHGELEMAGTGYTGEPGAEICTDAGTGAALMTELVEAGATPCGLGARDTLRLEAGLALWGEDIDETTTPLEAGIGFAVSFDHDFVGKGALEAQRVDGLSRRLCGLVLDERGIPRHGHHVETESGASGTVTSGNLSPVLDAGIALAYLSPPVEAGERLTVTIRDRAVAGHVVAPPFHRI